MVRSATSTLPRIGALLGLVVLLAGFVVIVAGLAKLQKITNGLGPAADIPPETVALYDTTFSNSLITPYAGAHGFQFSYIWFIIFFNLFNFLYVAAIIALPGFLYAGRNGALALLAVATTLTITVVNNLQYMKRNPFANTAYGKRNIDVTFAGAILVAIGDFLIILALGSWSHDVGNTAAYYGTNKRTPATTTTTEPATATTTV